MYLEKLVIDNIRRFRLEKGISQEKLAIYADTSPSYIGLMETYKNIPKLSTIERIAEALNVPVLELFKENPGNINLPSQNQNRTALKQKLKSELVKNLEKEIDDMLELL